jgi:hypothetical protein
LAGGFAFARQKQAHLKQNIKTARPDVDSMGPRTLAPLQTIEFIMNYPPAATE